MALVEQFGHPRGAVGWCVGQLMAFKNGKRSRFALELLGASPGESVLEVGFGPGVDLERLSALVGDGGHVAGIDVSSAMLRQAMKRNRRAIGAGRMDLRLGSAGDLPFEDARFDAVYSTNSAQFWPDLARGFAELARTLESGGRCVVVVQPMSRGATEADSAAWADKLELAAVQVGLSNVCRYLRVMKPVSAAAIVAFRR